MANKKRHKPKERVIAERLAHGNLLAAAPGVQELARISRQEYEDGLSEEQVRQRIRSRLESEGLTVRRMLLPGFTRKILRIPLRKLLRALADYMADRSPSKRLGGALDSMLDKVGKKQTR